MRILYEFNPLKITFIDVPPGIITGEVPICVKDVKVKVYDLSMGMSELSGAGVYGESKEMQLFALNVTNDGATLQQIRKVAYEMADKVEEMDKLAREHFLKKPLL